MTPASGLRRASAPTDRPSCHANRHSLTHPPRVRRLCLSVQTLVGDTNRGSGITKELVETSERRTAAIKAQATAAGEDPAEFISLRNLVAADKV